MYQSPNKNKKAKYTTSNNPYARGDNNINAKLQKAIKIILADEYYEGSEFGQYYNETREDGKSAIYVDQPELERELEKSFFNEDSDCVKYLVGPTGIGKTTLIRNTFLVFDRKAVLNNNNLIIYVSFYSMMNSKNDVNVGKDNTPIINTIATAFREAIDIVDGTTLLDRIQQRNVSFYKELYSFISNNNKLIENSVNDFNIDEEAARNAVCMEKYMLDQMEKNNTLDYNMSLFKYYLSKYEKEKGTLFKNIILILDDVEAAGKNAKGVVEHTYHILKCMQAYKSNHIRYHIKCLIAMRNYSFRNDITIIKEASRTYIGTDLDSMQDVILKETAPALKQIIGVRTDYILNHKDVIALYREKDSYTAASNILKIVLTKIYGKYDKMLLYLTHDNIFSSMELLYRIITNKQYIGKYEMDRTENGAFVLSDKDYSFENTSNNSNIPGNMDVFFALVYGEQELYIDGGKDYYLTNIMHYKKSDHVETELLGLYIIMYFIAKKINVIDDKYDGFETVNVMDAMREMTSVFDFHTIDDKNEFWNGAHEMMKHLYLGGVLRQSLVSPIIPNNDKGIREYSDGLNVFLSKRGYQLFKMLQYNSLLLSVYRDDIDTELENNDKPTTGLSTTNRLDYCMKYIDYLIEKEMDLFRQTKSYKAFIEKFGTTLATQVLLSGIEQSIITYYQKPSSEKIKMINKYNELGEKINKTIRAINRKHSCSFELVRLIKQE